VRSVLTLLVTWSFLFAAPILGPPLGEGGALLATQGLAALFLLATRAPSKERPRPRTVALALVAGYASFPACVAAAVAAGLWLDLAPIGAAPPWRGGALLSASLLVTAPLFEEILYRERLFAPLRVRWGTAPALLVTSALFAAPHLEPWPILATFLVGLCLGAFRSRGAPIAACIAMHAGLNLASIACGAPPVQLALDPATSALVGAAAAAGSLSAAAPRRRGRPGAPFLRSASSRSRPRAGRPSSRSSGGRA
jgi:membrane protease YdiL (CAAX protease family)